VGLVGPETAGGTVDPVGPDEPAPVPAGLAVPDDDGWPVPPPKLNPKAREPPATPDRGCVRAAEARGRPDVAFEPPRPRWAPPAMPDVSESECAANGLASSTGVAAREIGAAVAVGSPATGPVRSPGAPPPPPAGWPMVCSPADAPDVPFAASIGNVGAWAVRVGSPSREARLNGRKPKPGGATIALADLRRSRGSSVDTGL
jgi:hypothetical protein